MRFAVLVCLLFYPLCWASDDLQSQAEKYLKDYSVPQLDKAWEAKWIQRCEQKMNDNQSISGIESASNLILFDFIADRSKKLKDTTIKLTVDEKIDLCRCYLLYLRRKWKIPADIDPYITKENYDKWFAVTEIKK